MLEANRNMEAAILLGVLLTIVLYFLIPATCPGFPRPVVKQISYANDTTSAGDRIFYITGIVGNEGTRGNVIVTTALMNTTNKTGLTNTSTTVFMLPGEEKTIRAVLTGRVSEPCEIRITAHRK
jgi:hypothetical protein